MGIPTRAPDSFFAGDTVKWTVNEPDYLPADGWVASADLTNAANQHYSVTGTDNGDGLHLITIDGTTSAGIAAADYSLVVTVKKGSERHVVSTSSLVVRPDIASAADPRSHVKKTLDAIEAYLEDPNNLTAASYSIAGRSLNRMPVTEVITLHSRYQKLWRDEQNAERLASGQKPRRRLLTRMAG